MVSEVFISSHFLCTDRGRNFLIQSLANRTANSYLDLSFSKESQQQGRRLGLKEFLRALCCTGELITGQRRGLGTNAFCVPQVRRVSLSLSLKPILNGHASKGRGIDSDLQKRILNEVENGNE
jgi:hypothetical protein